MSHEEALTNYLSAFVAELVHAGVSDVVISPGSRSTPLAMLVAEHPDLRVHIQVDERSAAFFALGIAKATKKPTAILCTSGTAAANYYPAIIEAFHSRVPLIVLTADRPHELRDVGAPQAIDQIHLYGHNVKWFVEMAPPENNESMINYVRTVCARAVTTAQSAPAGPVHLNFPFREPLVPNLEKEDLFSLPYRELNYVKVTEGSPTLNHDQIDDFAQRLKHYKKGIIVCGSIEEETFIEAVIQLSHKLKYPIVADPLSQLRSGSHDKTNIIDTYATFLKFEEVKKELKPEIIIRFGAMPVSKALTIFIKENKTAEHWIIDSGNRWRDPTLSATEMIYSNETDFCQLIGEKLDGNDDSTYLETWQKINQITKKHLGKISEVTGASEGRLFYELSELVPEGSTLFVGNSMPIRDLDTFFHCNEKSIRIMANRGVNGIDGTISTALGAAVEHQPLYLIVGDLTFFHDLTGLALAKLYQLNINIIVINNNGGGIFSFLSQASHPKHFEALFGTPLNIQYEKVVEMFGGQYELVRSWDDTLQSFHQLFSKEGLSVLEVSTNRADNFEEHRNLWKFVSQEILHFLNGESG